MSHSYDQLRQWARAIWDASVDAVRSERLVGGVLRVEGDRLHIAGESLSLSEMRRIVVVGAGKAGAGMAAAVEEALGPELLQAKSVSGWINVPEDCVRPLRCIHLHAARPAGINEPTAAGAEGAARILSMVEGLEANDLCLCLISGGGSALLPAPVEAITLDDKLAVTRHLSGAGANIEQLNTVRKQLSRMKGGGLVRACRAGQLISLIISDVLGDPLDVIASGPTVEDSSTPSAALKVLKEFQARDAGISPRVFEYLQSQTPVPPKPQVCRTRNVVIGNNETAVRAAAQQAKQLGLSVVWESAGSCEGAAETLGRDLAQRALNMNRDAGSSCLISGGEPVVKLVEASRRGLGGRNQQLVLAAARCLERSGGEGIVILSGGTDGEDGPTDAAGALWDLEIGRAARAKGLDVDSYLSRNDAYRFFDPLDALIKTGPTHTNVCDVRVIVVARKKD